MTANAAGPVMTLYLVAQGVEKRRFLGTSALFFFGVNLCKVPFSVGLGLFSGETLWRTRCSLRSCSSGPGSACTPRAA